VSRRALRQLSTLLGLTGLLALPAPAQPQEEASPAAGSGVEAPVARVAPAPIASAEVAGRGQEENDRIQRLIDRAKPEPAV
jgi:hypothetical protein